MEGLEGGGVDLERESEIEREKGVHKDESVSLTCLTVVQAARGLLFGTHRSPPGIVGAAQGCRGLWENPLNQLQGCEMEYTVELHHHPRYHYHHHHHPMLLFSFL